MSALNYRIQGEGSAARIEITFSPVSRAIRSWREEVYAAARAVAGAATKPLWVCASGGYDSEITCRAFLDQNIDFSVLTLVHHEGTNHHDIRFIVEWCKEAGVRHELVSFSVTDFLLRGIDRYAEYPAIHPFRYLQLYLMERVEERHGYAVLASGEQLYQADPRKESWNRGDMSLPLSNGSVIPLAWCNDTNTRHEPYFHFATPEVCLAYLTHPLVAAALDNPDAVFRHEANAYTLKRLVYQSAWPDLQVRYKSHGFEKIKPLYEATKDKLREKFMAEYQPVAMPVVTFEQQLRASI